MNLVEQLRVVRLDEPLARLEGALETSVASEDPFVSEVAGHLIGAGGKRLRPALLLASAVAGGADVDARLIQAGVSVELVHLGSLYHDDVMDDAATRRGVESVNVRWGNLVAILVGDFLLARASEIAAALGTEVSGLLAATIARLCEGEIREWRRAFDPGRTREEYLVSIGGKTASLFSTVCRIGGLVADLPAAWTDGLTDFGHAFGMAFQIWDDVRDLIGTEDELGKPAGHDMVEGTYTLPVILALGEPGIGDDLRALLGGRLEPPARDKARDLIIATGAIPSSIDVARTWAAKAVEALGALPRSETGDALGALAFGLLDELPTD